MPTRKKTRSKGQPSAVDPEPIVRRALETLERDAVRWARGPRRWAGPSSGFSFELASVALHVQHAARHTGRFTRRHPHRSRQPGHPATSEPSSATATAFFGGCRRGAHHSCITPCRTRRASSMDVGFEPLRDGPAEQRPRSATGTENRGQASAPTRCRCGPQGTFFTARRALGRRGNLDPVTSCNTARSAPRAPRGGQRPWLLWLTLGASIACADDQVSAVSFYVKLTSILRASRTLAADESDAAYAEDSSLARMMSANRAMSCR